MALLYKIIFENYMYMYIIIIIISCYSPRSKWPSLINNNNLHNKWFLSLWKMLIIKCRSKNHLHFTLFCFQYGIYSNLFCDYVLLYFLLWASVVKNFFIIKIFRTSNHLNFANCRLWSRAINATLPLTSIASLRKWSTLLCWTKSSTVAPSIWRRRPNPDTTFAPYSSRSSGCRQCFSINR